MATITINTQANQDSRIQTAFGKILNLRDAQGNYRLATGAEIKQATIDWLKQSVREREQADAREAAQSTVTDVTPT